MGPIARKLLSDLRRASRSEMIDLAAVRRMREEAAGDEQHPADDAELPAGSRFWMRAFADLCKFAWPLLGLRHLRKLRDRVEQSEERFMPGGPPMSPLTDSFHTCWALADTTIGLKKESLTAIAVEVARSHRAPAELLAAWQAIADSYPGIYRVCDRSGLDVVLEDLVTGARMTVALADDVPGRAGDIWWTRLLPPPPFAPDAGWTSITTPYLFHPRAQRDWQDFFDRQLAGTEPGKRAAAYRRLMKQGAGTWYWFDYIIDAYVGQSGCAVVLTGVPDRPETLPHSEQNEAAGVEAPPLERLRTRLRAIANERGVIEPATSAFAMARERMGLRDEDPTAWPEHQQLLLDAFILYAAPDEDGQSALAQLANDASADLDAGERAALDALLAGWFSVFEVVRIKIDEGLEVRDVFRRKRFWIRERSATRQLSLGDLIAGWVMDEGGTMYLEGRVMHVPQLWASVAVPTLRTLMDLARSSQRRTGWRDRHALIVPLVSTCLTGLLERPPPVRLVNHHGEDLLWSESLYDVPDRDAVAEQLASWTELDSDDEGSYQWMDPVKRVLVAEIELGKDSLQVRANSKERIARVRALIDERLGEKIRHRADSFSDPQSQSWQGPAAPVPAPEDLPDALRAVLTETIEQTLADWLDTRVPALGNRTPRQAVKTETGRDHVSALLLEQERALRRGPGAGAIDFARLWRELGLRYPSHP